MRTNKINVLDRKNIFMTLDGFLLIGTISIRTAGKKHEIQINTFTIEPLKDTYNKRNMPW